MMSLEPRPSAGWQHGLLGALLLWTSLADARPTKKPDPTPPPAGHPQDPMEVENGAQPATTPPPADGPSGASSNPGGRGPSSGGSSGSGSGGGSSGASEPAQSGDRPSAPMGRVMANFKLGPAFCALNCAHQGAAVLELGAAVLSNRSLYFIIPLQFQFAAPNPALVTPVGNAALLVPLGVEYDIALPWLAGLYIYPRLSLGYALLIDNTGSGPPTTNAGVLIPELGLKYVYRGRWNLGGEFFSMPVIFGRGPAGGFGSLFLRLMLSVGVNF